VKVILADDACLVQTCLGVTCCRPHLSFPARLERCGCQEICVECPSGELGASRGFRMHPDDSLGVTSQGLSCTFRLSVVQEKSAETLAYYPLDFVILPHVMMQRTGFAGMTASFDHAFRGFVLVATEKGPVVAHNST